MLDVHPPEHAAHTWRDFLIHIATIVVGLLIAIGLEQTVEWIHHRHQVETARERIREEIEVNLHILDQNVAHSGALIDRLDQNMVLLRAAETHKPIAGRQLDFSWDLQGFYDAAYRSGHDSGVLMLLPYDEAAMYDDAYKFEDIDQQDELKQIAQMNTAQASMRGHTLEQISPEEIQTLLTAISLAREQALFLRSQQALLRSEWEAALSGHYRTDFAGSNK